MGKQRAKVEKYHPGPLSKMIYEKLLELNANTADIRLETKDEKTSMIIYKGLRIINVNEVYKVQQYTRKFTVNIENKFLLELIIKTL